MLPDFATSMFLFIIGTAVGSFLNVLIDRLPNDQSILGRSHCDYCKKTLEARDLIPIFSFLALRGRCRRCHRKLSWFYPGVEALTGIAFILTWQYAPAQSVAEQVLYLAFTSILIAIFFADLKSQIIPDELQVSLIIWVLLISVLHLTSTPVAAAEVIKNLGVSLFSGLLVGGVILALFLITRGRGMGFGDVKLAFTVGLFSGFLKGLVALYIAFIVGAVVGIALIIFGRKGMKSKIAFGPFIIIGFTLVTFLWNEVSLIFRSLYHF